MSFLADNKRLLVVYKDMPESALTEEVDIIITPQFYSVKKETLPIKFSFQAKRIAASIFEGMLEEEKHYEYFVFKEGAEWVFIAYCMEEILDFLKSKYIDVSMVNRLFFAEQFVQSFQAPYLLSEDDALAVIDHTVVILPKTMIEGEAFSSVFDSSTRPKNSLTISRASGLLVSTKQAVPLAVIFIFMAILYLVEGSRYDGTSGSTTEAYEALVKSNPALANQYQRESILSKYEKIDTAERSKREMIKNLGSMIIKGVTLESIKLDDKGFKAYLIVKDLKMIKNIETIAKNANLKTSKLDSASGIYVEGKL